MSQKTIKLSNLPTHLTKVNIMDALSEFMVSRVHLESQTAYVLIENSTNLEGLQFSSDHLIVPALADVTIQSPPSTFDWSEICSQLKEVESLKSEKNSEFDAAQYLVLQPQFNKRILIRNCHPEKIQTIKEQYLLKQVFSQFPISNITKEPNQQGTQMILINLHQPFSREKLTEKFQEIKLNYFGPKAELQEEDDENNFLEEQKLKEKCLFQMERNTFFLTILFSFLVYVILC